MALIQCYECGGQVSTAAQACPHCGAPAQQDTTPREAPPPRKRKRKGGLTNLGILVILLAIIFGMWWNIGVGDGMEIRCKTNFRGEGSCEFRNSSIGIGERCAYVCLKNKKRGTYACSGRVCSGVLFPTLASTRRAYLKIPKGHCGKGLWAVLDAEKHCKLTMHWDELPDNVVKPKED